MHDQICGFSSLAHRQPEANPALSPKPSLASGDRTSRAGKKRPPIAAPNRSPRNVSVTAPPGLMARGAPTPLVATGSKLGESTARSDAAPCQVERAGSRGGGGGGGQG